MSRAALIIEKGDALVRVVDWEDSNGTPINLTGYTALCTITVGDTTYTLTEGSGLTTTPLAGQIQIKLTGTQTNAFASQYGIWRLRVTSAGNDPTTLAEGYVFVSF